MNIYYLTALIPVKTPEGIIIFKEIKIPIKDLTTDWILEAVRDLKDLINEAK